MLTIGERIPDLILNGPEGKPVRLLDLAGERSLVVYFYPKDDTPICTAQACSFRDRHDDFAAAGAAVVGISEDPASSHESFAARHRLPFPLLSDESGEARRAFGIKPLLGLLHGRATFVVDREGVVRYAYAAQFRAKGHVDRSLEAARGLSRAGGSHANESASRT